jgi:hypothetical protein
MQTPQRTPLRAPSVGKACRPPGGFAGMPWRSGVPNLCSIAGFQSRTRAASKGAQHLLIVAPVVHVRFCHVVVVRRWVCSVCRARAPCAVAGPISGWMICGGARCISSVARIKRRCSGQRTCKALQTRGRGRTLPQHALCGKSGREPRNDKYMGHHFRDCIRGTLIGIWARVCGVLLEQKTSEAIWQTHGHQHTHTCKYRQHCKHRATTLCAASPHDGMP